MSEFQASNFKKENGGTPDLLGKTELTSPYFFVPPSGTTAERPESCAAGTLRFNTDIGTLEVYRGDTIGWVQIQRREKQYLGGDSANSVITTSTNSNRGTGTRGIFFGGYKSPDGRQNYINFLTISTLGNTQDFGDLNDHTGRPAATSSTTRAICVGGFQSPALRDILQFVTIASIGNATDFGDLTLARNQLGAFSNQVRGIAMGGNPETNLMDFHTISTTGNAQDFGDMTSARMEGSSTSDSTRGVFAGGNTTGPSVLQNVIDFVEISTTGNASDFGDFHAANSRSASTSRGHGGL